MSTAGLADLIADLCSGEAQRAEAAALALAQLPPDDSLNALSELLQDPDHEKRWWAVRALAEVRDPRAGHFLAGCLQDDNDDVRQCAALGLRQHPQVTALPGLIALLESEDQLTARLAADALIALGPEATEALIDVLQKHSGYARVQAARALALIGDRRAITPLFWAYKEGSSLVQHWASEGLDRMGLGMRFFSPN